MSTMCRMFMLLMTTALLGLTVVNAPELEDKVFISALSVIHRINLTEKKCTFKMHHELQSFQDTQNGFRIHNFSKIMNEGLQTFQDTPNGIRIYNFSRIYISDPEECLHTKINVINQSGSEMKPFLFNSPQNLTELEELYWPDENNESPPSHFTTIGKLITDKVTYKKLTEISYTLLADGDAVDKAVVDIYAPSGRGEAFTETCCSFRRHLQLEDSFFQNNTWYFNISKSFIPNDDDCLNTEIEELIFANSGTMRAIYNSSQTNNIKGRNQPWRNAKHKIEIKSIRSLITEDDDFAYLMQTEYRTLMSKEGAEFKDKEFYAMNVEPKGEKHFSEKYTNFRKYVTYTVVKQGCIELYNISERYIPDDPEYLSTNINVIKPKNIMIPFIYNTNQDLKKMRVIVGLDKFYQTSFIVQRTTIGAQMEAEKSFAFLNNTTHRLISWEEAEREGIISNRAEHEENSKLCYESVTPEWLWPVVIAILVLAIIFGYLCYNYNKSSATSNNDDINSSETRNNLFESSAREESSITRVDTSAALLEAIEYDNRREEQ